MSDAAPVLILVTWVVASVLGMRHAYLRGLSEGYGYSKEPGNALFKNAGEWLKANMKHRWRELDENRPKGKLIPPQGGSGTARPQAFKYIAPNEGEIIYHGDPNSIKLKVEQCEN